MPAESNGYTLEMHVIDSFPMATKGRWTVMEVHRDGEFAPVKSEPGSAVDSPDFARRLL
jgi:hypothetical protein